MKQIRLQDISLEGISIFNDNQTDTEDSLFLLYIDRYNKIGRRKSAGLGSVPDLNSVVAVGGKVEQGTSFFEITPKNGAINMGVNTYLTRDDNNENYLETKSAGRVTSKLTSALGNTSELFMVSSSYLTRVQNTANTSVYTDVNISGYSAVFNNPVSQIYNALTLNGIATLTSSIGFDTATVRTSPTFGVGLKSGSLYFGNIKTSNFTKEQNYELSNSSGTIPTLVVGTVGTTTSTGVVGEIKLDANYLYVCYAPNTWRRVAIVAF